VLFRSLDAERTWVLDELAGLRSDEPDRDLLTGLHAKIYVVEHGRSARVLLGSANATDAAFGGNVEFLVEIAGGRTAYGIDAMTGPDAPFRKMLGPYYRREPVEPDEERLDLEGYVCDLAALPLTALVERDPGTGGYGIRLRSVEPAPAHDGVRVTAQLQTRRGEARVAEPGRPVDVRFGGLDLLEITPYVLLTATMPSGVRAEAIALADLVGDPSDRLDQVLAGQIRRPDDFLRFLALLLGLGIDPVVGAGEAAGAGGLFRVGAGQHVLELLLSALADRPGQVDDLARQIEHLEATERGRAVMPEGFRELWAVVNEARLLVNATGVDA